MYISCYFLREDIHKKIGFLSGRTTKVLVPPLPRPQRSIFFSSIFSFDEKKEFFAQGLGKFTPTLLVVRPLRKTFFYVCLPSQKKNILELNIFLKMCFLKIYFEQLRIFLSRETLQYKRVVKKNPFSFVHILDIAC